MGSSPSSGSAATAAPRGGRWTTWCALNGPRVPDAATAPQAWRIAFALVVPRGTGASIADLAKLDTLRTRFPRRGSPGVTDGRAHHGRLARLAARGRWRIAHDPARGHRGRGRPTALRGARAHRGRSAALASSIRASVRLWWRTAGAPAWNQVALASAGADSFAATVPVRASTARSSTTSRPPATRADSPPRCPPPAPRRRSATRSEPTSPRPRSRTPRSRRAPPRSCRSTLLARVTDNLGVDSVWAEVAVDGGGITLVPATRAGTDSFTVAVGAGLASGQRLTYRLRGARRLGGPSRHGGAGESRDARDRRRLGRGLGERRRRLDPCLGRRQLARRLAAEPAVVLALGRHRLALRRCRRRRLSLAPRRRAGLAGAAGAGARDGAALRAALRPRAVRRHPRLRRRAHRGLARRRPLVRARARRRLLAHRARRHPARRRRAVLERRTRPDCAPRRWI